MFKSDKPVTAITVLIERLTKEEYEVEDLSDLPTLIESIRLQNSTGPTEVARAIRKKLKYGSPHRQLRALVILDALIENAGPSFQRRFADEPLLERLRLIVTEPVTDVDVRTKCNELYRQWAVAYKGVPGMEETAALYKQLPQRKRNKPQQRERAASHAAASAAENPFGVEDPGPRERSGSLRSTQTSSRHASSSAYASSADTASFPAALHSPIGTASAKKDRRASKDKAAKPFKFEKERAQIAHTLTQANLEATGLMNALKLLDRERARVSADAAIRARFQACRALHGQTLRYCSLVTDESYLGALLQANDQLAEATRLYEQLDRSFDYDSDSEDYGDGGGAAAGGAAAAAKGKTPVSPPAPLSPAAMGARRRMASLSLNEPESPGLPPRPAANPTFAFSPADGGKGKARQPAAPPDPDDGEDEDEDDPFADRNAVTPRVEKDAFSF